MDRSLSGPRIRGAARGNKDCAQIVQDCLLHSNGLRYRLFAWCVMPNHVHAIIGVLATSSLEQIMHTWKSFTAKRINRDVARSGAVWQREYFDRLLRNEAEQARAVRYVLRNPEKAGLRDWKFVGELE
ncbi:MAG: transposase [Acidobacteriaceae bacterium]